MKKLLLLAVCIGTLGECRAGWLPDFIVDFFWNKKDITIYEFTHEKTENDKRKDNITTKNVTYFKLEKGINQITGVHRVVIGLNNGKITISSDENKLFINNYSGNYFYKNNVPGNWIQAIKIKKESASDLKATGNALTQTENTISEYTAIETSLNKTRATVALIGACIVGYLASSHLSNSKKKINI